MLYSPSVAFLTGSVGAGEWIVLFVVVLIVVGPKRLPEVARKIGRTMEMFRRAADEFKDQLMNMDQESSSTSASSTPESSSEDVDGVTSDPYANPYPDDSGYPGNEDHVENWSSEATADAEGRSDAGSTSEGVGSDIQESASEDTDKPAEGGQ